MFSYIVNEMKDFYLKINFHDHMKVKHELLECFSKIQPVKSTGQYTDNIYKVDWYESENKEREWTKIFFPYLGNILYNISNDMGYAGYEVNQLWFQQYIKDGNHGWHTHGCNFTFVYYVELPDGAPTTQLIEPMTGKMIESDVKEGDMLLFSSHIIHRAPLIKKDLRKTIISANINISNPTREKSTELNAKYGN